MSGRHLNLAADDKRDSVPAVTLPDFLGLRFPPREDAIYPWLPTQGSAMISAWRGVGKTQVSVGCAIMLATATSFLRWSAPKPRKVLFVDGEMPGSLLQERFAQAIARVPNASMPANDYLRIITPDMMPDFMPIPDLNTSDGQTLVEDNLDGVEVMILDNVSTLFRSGDSESKEESWRAAQDWVLRLRRLGISIILIHHLGKNGSQRGTSKREDILDTSIKLTRPDGYSAKEGARFVVHFEKTRGVIGEAVTPFEAWLQDDIWTTRLVEDVEVVRVLELHADGMTQREIAGEVGFSAAKVNRILKDKGRNDASA